MNYEDMSDFEINKAVATHESLIVNESQSTSKNPSAVMVNDIVQSFMFDPCNNPSDAWPIIVGNDINLSKHKVDDYWFAFVRAEDLGVSEFKCKDNNPLRAAMICFLKMKDAER